MSLILTRDEVAAWTGYQRPSKQIEVLRSQHVRFNVGRDGYPRVLRTDLNPSEKRAFRRPNLEAVKALGRMR